MRTQPLFEHEFGCVAGHLLWGEYFKFWRIIFVEKECAIVYIPLTKLNYGDFVDIN
jgi:hypothetical protein